ncbi:MAG: MBL fold metallo-hydrolase [Verrucomicrobiia bacterium]
MKITFWGTRGSIPTPSTSTFETQRYGGDTTCLSVESGDLLLILDAGSGLRLLGLDLLKRPRPLRATFLFSHLHWDHIQGFPFFMPAFYSENSFRLLGPPLAPNGSAEVCTLERALRRQQDDLSFPVTLEDMSAGLAFGDLPAERLELVGAGVTLRIRWAPLKHPGGCYGYRIEEHREGRPPGIFAFCTDTENGGELNPSVQSLAEGAAVLVHDAQYSPDEYVGKGGHDHIGWGHSTWAQALEEAKAAGVPRLYLTHHDPLHDDSRLALLEREAAEAAQKDGIEVRAAAQFMSLEI